MASRALTVEDYEKDIPGKIDKTRAVWVFPTVVSTNAHGRRTEWTLHVRLRDARKEGIFYEIEKGFLNGKKSPEGMVGIIETVSGVVGGKTRKTVPTILANGKNIGKKNETNVLQQAMRDALGMYNKQIKRANPGGGDDASSDQVEQDSERGVVLPMLASSLKDLKKMPKVTSESPAFVQRKYNGVRAIASLREGRVVLTSRTGIEYPGMQNIRKELRAVLSAHPGVSLDGEIYKHGAALQDISGAARGASAEDFDYMIYDMFDPTHPEKIFSQRLDFLRKETGLIEQDGHCKLVETFEISDIGEVNALCENFVREGYEGAMLRLDEPYRESYNGYHSHVLLKVKPVYDHEFEIVDFFTAEKGKSAGALMLVCRVSPSDAHAGTTAKREMDFNVTPAMEIPRRIELAKQFTRREKNGRTHFENSWKGKKIIVEFDEWSRNGIPQRARTRMEVRTWE